MAQLIFASGLSTAEAVTELAGRGVGMDVVRNEIASIGGRIDIATARGQGTTFTVYLPLTLAVTQAVLVRCGRRACSPSPRRWSSRCCALQADALAGLYETKRGRVPGPHLPAALRSQHLLGALGATELQPYNSVLLLRSGIQRIALHVDELLGNQEIVVKSIGPQLARVPGVGGATVLADGRIVLIINPVQLAQRTRSRRARLRAHHARAAPAGPRQEAPTPPRRWSWWSTTRSRCARSPSRLLEREGYQVLTAKDGVDALEQMSETLPGGDAGRHRDAAHGRLRPHAQRARRRRARKDIPIIIISSRTAEKHRSQAAQLGVNAFLGKPYPGSRAAAADREASSACLREVRAAGAAIGKYPVIREIGSGATSRVYLARDPFAARDVAIKVYLFDRDADPHDRAHDAQGLRRRGLARRQARTIPHIVEIYDAVVEPDHSYLVMEYVPGTTLEAHSGVSTPAAAAQGGRDHLQVRSARSSTPSSTASSTATSSRATSCSRRRARPRWATSARRSSTGPGTTPRRSRASARPPTCRPSRCAWRRSTSRPTSTRSASPCTACSPAGCPTTRPATSALTHAILNTPPPPPADAAARPAAAARPTS